MLPLLQRKPSRDRMRTRVSAQELAQIIVGSPEFSMIDRSARDESGGNTMRLVPFVTLAKTGSSKLSGTPGGVDTGSGAGGAAGSRATPCSTSTVAVAGSSVGCAPEG